MKRLIAILVLPLLLGVLGLCVLFNPRLQATPAPVDAPRAQSIDAQLRSFVPARISALLLGPRELRVQHLAADFDNSGRYDYLVVAYIAPGFGGKLRVLKNVGGRLSLHGEVDSSDRLELDGTTRLRLVYVDNSGVPVVEADSVSANGMYSGMDLYRWIGGKLVSMSSGEGFSSAHFADPAGTGVPQIIESPDCSTGKCAGPYNVYQLKEGTYELAATAKSDPSGLLPPPGESLPLPGKVMLAQRQFSAAEILASSSKKGGSDVVLRFGNLAPMSDSSSSTDVAEVDLASIYAGRNLKPSSVRVVGAEQGKAEGFDGPFIEITLPRTGVLKYLAKVQPSKAPAPGDTVTLPVNARLKNGLVLYGFASVRIVGDTGS